MRNIEYEARRALPTATMHDKASHIGSYRSVKKEPVRPKQQARQRNLHKGVRLCGTNRNSHVELQDSIATLLMAARVRHRIRRVARGNHRVRPFDAGRQSRRKENELPFLGRRIRRTEVISIWPTLTVLRVSGHAIEGSSSLSFFPAS